MLIRTTAIGLALAGVAASGAFAQAMTLGQCQSVVEAAAAVTGGPVTAADTPLSAAQFAECAQILNAGGVTTEVAVLGSSGIGAAGGAALLLLVAAAAGGGGGGSTPTTTTTTTTSTTTSN